MNLRAPFPWFGGKSRCAHLVWERFGDVANYVEPFFGSGAVLLARPTTARTETVNDADCYLANFWRAVQSAPDAVAEWADWPVNEADLHARHRWLVSRRGFAEQMKADPDFFDAKIAGWWVWGLCAWIGSGWCLERLDGAAPQVPSEQLPHLGSAGMGLHRKLPHLGDAGRGDVIGEWLALLSERLARVRVACGDWTRVTGPSVTEKHGITGVFLDPPYADAKHDVTIHSAGSGDVFGDVRTWALANGDNRLLRIALCGYEDEHEMPSEWEYIKWKTSGGYAGQRKSGTNKNRHMERIWFSPACLQPRNVAPLFETVTDTSAEVIPL